MSAERYLTAEVIAKIKAKLVKPILFVFADFPDGARRLCTAHRDTDWDGHMWTAVGSAIGFSTISETTDTEAKGISATLNGLDADLVASITGTAYQGRTVTIWLGFYDVDDVTSFDVISDPFWKGQLDTDDQNIGGKKTDLTINAENRLVDILRKREWRCTDRDQQLLHPGEGDTFFNKVERIQDTKAPWGRQQA